MEMAWEPHGAVPVLHEVPVPPYGAGDEVQVTDPSGAVYRAAVERVVPDDEGYRVVAQVLSPRRYRDQVVVVRVGADGHGPHASPWSGETVEDLDDH